MSNPDITARLKNAEGHLRGIQRMLDEDAYCIDVIRQIQAVQAALNKVTSMILNDHLNSCVITAIRGMTRPSASAFSKKSAKFSRPLAKHKEIYCEYAYL